MIEARRRFPILALLLAASTGGCALPSLEGRSVSHALPLDEARQTRLGQALATHAQDHPQQTGILPLSDALDAFAARALLAHAAEKTLDVQYYIWRGDITGTLLLQTLFDAAERGVRVRLLLDDNGIPDMDALLAALDTHPQIEVRLFNPFSVRRPKALGYVTHFSRANRRMHNKSFTADNQVTIIGGRNVGDEYFGATEGVLFSDLDVLAAGAVVPTLSEDFDRYWDSASSYPIARLIDPPRQDFPTLIRETRAAQEPGRAERYQRALRESGLIRDLLEQRLGFEWAEVAMVSDDPAKGLGQAADEDLLPARLAEIIGRPQRQLDLVSPYFVPTASGVDALTAMVRSGVAVRVLTNALEATDVTAVHAGYAKRRHALLGEGVTLYEMQRRAGQEDLHERAGPFGSSGSSLHAKTFAVDAQRVFVGSFNFDPRSAKLNTELGFVIESPTLAQAVHAVFDDGVRQRAYEVQLDGDGRLYWLTRADAGAEPQRLRSEPGSGPLKRLWVRLLSWLPIEWLL